VAPGRGGKIGERRTAPRMIARAGRAFPSHTRGGDRFEVARTGTGAMRVHPLVIEIMAEVGIDLGAHSSKTFDKLLAQPWDRVITACDTTNDRRPTFPAGTTRLHWSFEDPSAAQGPRTSTLKCSAASATRSWTRSAAGSFCRRPEPPATPVQAGSVQLAAARGRTRAPEQGHCSQRTLLFVRGVRADRTESGQRGRSTRPS
jgi:arsenate reductase